MDRDEFERLLDRACLQLTTECGHGVRFATSDDFHGRVRQVLVDLLAPREVKVDTDVRAYQFPDFVMGEYGVDAKFTTGDSWRSVANSVFETTRSAAVRHIYVVYGKMGGTPKVRWGRYEDCVMHVRTSHVPRFEVKIGAKRSLFEKMGVTYDQFSKLSEQDRMRHIRKYARRRLKKGARLWWLEERADEGHSLPLEARLYMALSQAEKRRLRAEAALLCPQIVKPSRSKHKYDDAALYILTYHGVVCPQARDLFSAGSVALRADATRGGVYIMRALKDIEGEMRKAATTLEDALFVEYWGKSVPPDQRIQEWLRRADKHARGWKPSKELFQ
jgi:hypothetical protein